MERSSIFNRSETNYCFFFCWRNSVTFDHQSLSKTSFSTNVNIPTPPQPSDVTSVVHVTQVNMNVNIPTPPQPSDATSVVHVTQVNMNVNIPTPPQPSDVASVVHVTQVDMNVNIPTPPQPSDVTSVVHVTQVNMNVNIPTPPQPSDVMSVVHASISRATCLQSAKMPKTQGSLMAPQAQTRGKGWPSTVYQSVKCNAHQHTSLHNRSTTRFSIPNFRTFAVFHPKKYSASSSQVTGSNNPNLQGRK